MEKVACEWCLLEACACAHCALCGAKVPPEAAVPGRRPVCGYCAMCAEPEEEVELAVRVSRG